MCFKKITSLFLIMSVLSSCSWLRDKPKAQKGFGGGELDLSCLQVMPLQLQELFAGRYTESAQDQESVKAIWSCLDRSLNTFSKYTHGSNSTHYTDAELQDFANRYLPKDNLFSKNLVSSIFRLKTAVLGGNNQNINQTEINKLRAKLKRFGEIILPLSPHISALLKPYDSLSDNKMKVAGDELNKFITEFAILLEDSEQTVTWLDLSSFISELEKYLKAPDPTALTVVREQIQVFQYLKVMVVGGDEFGIEKAKWKPIFKSISTIYNALYLTTTSSEMMEQLGIEIQSNEAEQTKATEKLTNILKELKNDPTLYSKSTIQLFADRWSKALALNAFLYPKSQGKLALKAFLGSPISRKLTASLMDSLDEVQKGNQSVKVISKIADNLADLIEQAGLDQNTLLNINDFRKYVAQLKPLFTETSDYSAIDSSLDILQDVSSILIGNNSGNLGKKDFRTLIIKSRDLYAAWKTNNPADFNSSLSESLAILVRPPYAPIVHLNQIQGLLEKCEKLFHTLNLSSQIDWKQINKMILNGANLKAVLFGTTNENITNYELNQIINSWNAFSSKKEIDQVLESLANHFKNNPYSSVQISELFNAINAFMPDDKKLPKLGLTAELAGSIKAFLIGGKSEILDRSEYVKISQLAFTVYKNLKPVISDLPNGFKLGLNSTSFAIFEAAVQGLIDDKDASFNNYELKQLLLTQLSSSGLKVKPITIERLLIGLNYRILDGNKGKKIKSLPPSFNSSKLIGIKRFLEKTKLDYLDYENAFTGIDSKQSLPGSEIFKRLTRSDTKQILASIHPIMNGATSMPYFSANGKAPTDYYLSDLNYKSLIFHALLWVFPGYQIEADQRRTGTLPRLSLNDLIDLFDDINDAVYELGLSFSIEASKPSATKRMQSINLFTRTGNGDQYIDVMETVDFLTTTFAGKNLLNEVRSSLVKNCYPQNLSYLSQSFFSYECLTSAFFGKSQFTSFYNKVIPEMSDHFLSLNSNEAEEYRKSTLTAVKAGWNEKSMMDLSELETLVSIPYYVENIFIRLDHDFNGMLTFTEAMAGFPIFCREIKKAGGEMVKGSCEAGEEPRQVEAIYGHLLMKGVPPETFKKDSNVWDKIRIGKDFIVWNFQWKHLDRDPKVRDRNPPYLYRKDLLNIISNLSTSIAPPPESAQP